MSTPAEATEAFYTLFEDKNDGKIDDFLADNVELRPPTYGKSWVGKVLVSKLLRFASSSLQDFRYTDVFEEPSISILRFEATVQGAFISGVDVLVFDEESNITLVEIFTRSPKSTLMLRDVMAEHVRSDRQVAAMMNMAV